MKKYIAIIFTLLLLASCKDKDKFASLFGEPDSIFSIGVYFDDNNVANHVYATDGVEPREFQISIHRVKKATAVDVPIIFESSVEGLEVPSSIHFNAGVGDAAFMVKCTEAFPEYVMAEYSITVPDEYLNIYSSTQNNSINGTVFVSDWMNANKDGSDVEFLYTDKDYLATPSVKKDSLCFYPHRSKMEVLKGGNKYRIYDFLGGGMMFEFSLVKSPFPNYKRFWRIIPSDDYIWYDDRGEEYYNLWYYVGEDTEEEDTEEDEENEDYEAFVCNNVKDLDGNPTSFSQPSFYYYYTASSVEYCYARLADPTEKDSRCAASMWFWCQPADSRITVPARFYVYFEWDISGN